MEAMQAAGIAASDIIVMSTLNGARAMGDALEFGTLEKGKVADLLVLSEDPRTDIAAYRTIEQVVRNGQSFDQQALRYR